MQGTSNFVVSGPQLFSLDSSTDTPTVQGGAFVYCLDTFNVQDRASADSADALNASSKVTVPGAPASVTEERSSAPQESRAEAEYSGERGGEGHTVVAAGDRSKTPSHEVLWRRMRLLLLQIRRSTTD